MMSDYERTIELVNAANNSSGASNEQFEKTLDSLESKINKLKTAWQEYLMGLANNEIIKVGVDALTGLLNLVNNLTNAISGGNGLVKSIVTLMGTLGALKGGSALLKAGFSKIGSDLGKSIGLTPEKDAVNYAKVFKTKLASAFSGKAATAAYGNIVDFSKGAKELNTYNEALRRKNELQIIASNYAAREQVQSGVLKSFNDDLIASKNRLIISEIEYYNALNLSDKEKVEATLLTEQGFRADAAAALAKNGYTAEIVKEKIANGDLNKEKLEELAINNSLLMSKSKMIVSMFMSTGAARKEAIEQAKKTGVLKLLTKITDRYAASAIGAKVAMGVWVIAIAAVVAALVALGVALYNASPEAQLKAANKYLEQTTEVVDELNEKYSELNTILDELEDSQKTIEELERGTKEWTEAVIAHNQQMRELLALYPELSKYITSDNGVLSLDYNLEINGKTVDDVLEQQANNLIYAQSILANATYQKEVISNRITKQEIEDGFDNLGLAKVTVGTNVWGNQQRLNLEEYAVATNGIGKAVLDGLSESIDSGELKITGNQEQDTVALKPFLEKIFKEQGIEDEDSLNYMIQNWSQSLGSSSDILVNYNNALLTATGVTNEYARTIANNAHLISGVEEKYSEEEAQQASNFGNVIAEAVINNTNSKKGIDLTDADIARYATNMGYVWEGNYNFGGTKAKFETETGTIKVDLDVIAESLGSTEVTDTLATLENIYVSEGLGSTDPITQVVMAALGNGTALTQAQINTLLSEGELNLENIPQAVIEAVGGEAALENIVVGIAEDANLALDKANAILNKIPGISIPSNWSDKITADAQLNFAEILKEIFEGGGNVEGFLANITQATKSMNSEDLNKFLNGISGIDFSDIDSIKTLPTIIETLGLEGYFTDEELQRLVNDTIDFAKAIKTVDLKSLTEQIRGINDLRARILSGEQGATFNTEDYNQLVTWLPDIADDFIEQVDGSFIYIGSSMEGLAERIVAGVQNNVDAVNTTYDERTKAANLLAYNSDYLSRETSTWNRYNYLAGIEFFQQQFKNSGIDFTQLEIEGFEENSDFDNTEEYSEEVLKRIWDALVKYVSVEDLEIERAEAQDEVNSVGLTIDQMFAQGIGEDIIKQAIITEAIASGIDIEEITAYAETVEGAYSDTEKLAIAIKQVKVNKGFTELVDSYEDWSKYAKMTKEELQELSQTDPETFNAFKTSVEDMLGLDSNQHLSDDFWNNIVNYQLIKDAINQVPYAIEKLWGQVIKDLPVIGFEGVTIDSKAKQELITEAYNLVEGVELPNLEFGTTLNTESFAPLCNALINTSAETVAAVNGIFSQMGFTLVPEYGTINIPNIPGMMVDPAIQETNNRYQNLKLNTVTGYRAVSLSGGNVKLPSIVSGGSSGGSGGGSSDKKENFENPYDEYYNITEKINSLLETREDLERDYDKLLENRNTTLNEITRNSLLQISNLKEEIALQKQLQEGRLKQIANIGSETYADEEGNEVSYADWGATKYASLNTTTGVITIDWTGINAITDTEKGGAVEAYISRLEELRDSLLEINNAIDDANDNIEEIKERGKDEYLDFEQAIYDALVQQQQKIIDEYQSLNDTLNDSNSRILDSLRESIDLERQIRDNTKTEEDITEKEARLAYLRRDTSGANQLEIMQLEEELAEARENYSDTLIDQELERLNNANTKAQEQRERQIEILQGQLDYWTEMGVYWSEVYALLESSMSAEGQLKQNSALVELLKSDENFGGLSKFGQEDWIDDLIEKWLIAMQGLNNWKGEDNTSNNNTSNNNSNSSTGSSTPSTPTTTPSTSTTTTTKTIEVGGQINASGAKIYGYASSTYGANQYYSDDPIYTVLQVSGDWIRVRHHKLSSGTSGWFKKGDVKAYKTGGLVNETGLAWLDGTKTNPEMVLNAADTKNLIQLKDILGSILHGSNSITQNSGEVNIEVNISVEKLDSAYDVEQLAADIKREIVSDAQYRNVNSINFMR